MDGVGGGEVEGVRGGWGGVGGGRCGGEELEGFEEGGEGDLEGWGGGSGVGVGEVEEGEEGAGGV